jgi:hypothetical protein
VVMLEWADPIFAMGNWGPERVEIANANSCWARKASTQPPFLPGTVSQTAEIIAEILHTVSFGGRSEEVSWRSAESPVERVRG